MQKIFQKLIRFVCSALVLVGTPSCHSESSGPGMILSFGSVIDGKKIEINSATLPNGNSFSNPGAVGGKFDKTRETWRLGGVDATMGASGDYRGLPEWVSFEWQELTYPSLKPTDFPSDVAFGKYVDDLLAKAPIKTQRLEIKNRIPQEVVDEVIESKRDTPKGQLSEKVLWLYIFWTPDGMKMRWELRYDKGHKEGGFGHAIKEGGDDLDRYNQ